MKSCRTCLEVKPLDEYHKSNNKDGHSGTCKSCACERARIWYQNNSERSNAASQAWYRENREWYEERKNRYDSDVAFARSIRKKYQMSLDDYEDLLDSQNGGCAICGLVPVGKRLNVDHDHSCCPGGKHAFTCGKCVRALLCTNCNLAIGKLHDDPDLVSKALAYLVKWKAARIEP